MGFVGKLWEMGKFDPSGVKWRRDEAQTPTGKSAFPSGKGFSSCAGGKRSNEPWRSPGQRFAAVASPKEAVPNPCDPEPAAAAVRLLLGRGFVAALLIWERLVAASSLMRHAGVGGETAGVGECNVKTSRLYLPSAIGSLGGKQQRSRKLHRSKDKPRSLQQA